MHWLASAEAAAALYLIGALPFTLGLIWFASEMMQSPYAAERLPGASLVLALLFIWKQTWQGAFMASLRDTLAGSDTPWTAARAAGLLLRQATWQPLGLIAIPLAILAVVPGVAVVGYFRQLSLDPAHRRGRLSGMDPYFSAALFLLALLLLFANVLVLVIAGPQLILSFFGVRSTFSSLGSSAVNGVAFAVAGALTWLLLDPFLDARFTLHAFRAESRATALDLRAALRRALPLLALAISLPAQPIDHDRFDRAADQVLRQDEFAWRTRATNAPEGPVESWFRRAGDFLSARLDDLAEWFEKTFSPKPQSSPGQGRSPAGAVSQWLLGLSAIVLVIILVLLYRYWRAQREASTTALDPALKAIDLTDEQLGAEALEEDAWLSLADDLIARGDHRLAMRAVHLAGLRWLAGRSLISLERWKSGADYARELDRRARALPALPQGFRANLRRFEMTWYGRHEADAELAARARDAWKELRAHAS